MSFHPFDVTRRVSILTDLHPHTVKILARSTAIGATTPTNIPNFDAYVRSMYDIWITYCDVFYRFRGTGDVNFKRINLANPEGALADFYGGFTLDNSGFKGNGVNAYIDTNFNPSLLVSGQKYQLNDASRLALLTELGTNQISGTNSMGGYEIWTASVTSAIRINGNSNLSASVDLSSIGLKTVNKTNTDVLITNKDIVNNRTIASGSLSNSNITILKNSTIFSSSKVSNFGIGRAMIPEIIQAIRTAENADLANLGLPQIA